MLDHLTRAFIRTLLLYVLWVLAVAGASISLVLFARELLLWFGD